MPPKNRSRTVASKRLEKIKAKEEMKAKIREKKIDAISCVNYSDSSEVKRQLFSIINPHIGNMIAGLLERSKEATTKCFFPILMYIDGTYLEMFTENCPHITIILFSTSRSPGAVYYGCSNHPSGLMSSARLFWAKKDFVWAGKHKGDEITVEIPKLDQYYVLDAKSGLTGGIATLKDVEMFVSNHSIPGTAKVAIKVVENMDGITLESYESPPLCPCGNTGLQSCSKCESARYCSVVCQKDNWPTHKKECSSIGPSQYAIAKYYCLGYNRIVEKAKRGENICLQGEAEDEKNRTKYFENLGMKTASDMILSDSSISRFLRTWTLTRSLINILGDSWFGEVHDRMKKYIDSPRGRDSDVAIPYLFLSDGLIKETNITCLFLAVKSGSFYMVPSRDPRGVTSDIGGVIDLCRFYQLDGRDQHYKGSSLTNVVYTVYDLKQKKALGKRGLPNEFFGITEEEAESKCPHGRAKIVACKCLSALFCSNECANDDPIHGKCSDKERLREKREILWIRRTK